LRHYPLDFVLQIRYLWYSKKYFILKIKEIVFSIFR